MKPAFKILINVIWLTLLVYVLPASATPQVVTYQARIIKPDGYPLDATSVTFKFTILNPAATCILYSETYAPISMSGAAGMVAMPLGTGTKVFPTSATTFAQVFNNATPSLDCAPGGPADYQPGATDIRKIVMQFNDGNGWQTLPAMSINAVPYAIYASDAQNLGGVSATSYVKYSTIPTCTASQALQYTGASFNCVAVGNSSTTAGDIITALGYTPQDPSVVQTSFTTVTNTLGNVSSTVYAVSSTVNTLANSVTSLSNSVAASFSAMTSSQWSTSGTTINYLSGNVGIGTTTPASKLHVGVVPAASANYGTLSIGGGPFDGVTAGFFIGAASGTSLAVNELSTFTGSLINLQTNGISKFRIASDGNLNLGTTAYTTRSVWLTTGNQAKLELNAGGVGQEHQAARLMMGGHNGFGANFHVYYGSSADVNNGDFRVYDYHGSATATERFRINNVGNVGIGTTAPVTKLEVSGGVRISMESATCAVSYAGTIRYNSGSVEYCNGTAWSGFGGGSTVSASIISSTGNISVVPTSSFIVSSTAASTNSSTGALVVNGGVGVAGNLNSSGTVTATDLNFLSTIKSGGQTVLSVPENKSVTLGISAGASLTTGTENTFLGHKAGMKTTAGSYNLFAGTYAGQDNNGYENAFLGYMAGLKNTTGGDNTFVGAYAGESNTSGGYNTFVGFLAGDQNTTGIDNTALGQSALGRNNYGRYNVALGSLSLYANKSKAEATAVGYGSMQNADDTAVSSTSYNTALGAYSLRGSGTAANNTGTKNTAIGHSSLLEMTSGIGNIGLGYNAGASMTTGSYNVVIGSNNGASIATTSNNILIADGQGNERIRVSSSGNVGIGTSSPGEMLEIKGSTPTNGALRISTDAQSNTSGAQALQFGTNVSGSYVPTGLMGDTSSGDSNLKIFALQGSLQLGANVSGVASTRMTIQSDGNVGIGTTNPAALLSVTSSVGLIGSFTSTSASNSQINFNSSTGKNTNMAFQNAGVDKWYVGNDSSNDRFRLHDGVSEVFSVLRSSGNVGIGTTAPVTRLDVSGAIRISMDSATCVASYAGTLRYNSGDVEYCNGTIWAPFGVAGTGITSSAASIAQVLGYVPANSATAVSSQWTTSGTAINYASGNTLSISGTPVVYLPNQAITAFTGSIAFGDGLRSSSHTTGVDGYYNTAVGIGALYFNTTGNSNVANGTYALYSNTTGFYNVANGYNALYFNTIGDSNVANGAYALYSNTTGDSNIANGYSALYSNMTGSSNIAHGSNALYFNTTGSSNIVTGAYALRNNRTGNSNVAYGRSALYSNQTKSESTAIGYNSMQNADSVSAAPVISYNTAIGAYSLQGSGASAVNTGVRNTALGHSALKNMTSGSGNIGIGYDAGSAITTGSSNVVIGSTSASAIATSSNNVLIADGQGNERARINSSGNVGIGTTSPLNRLHVYSTTLADGLSVDGTNSPSIILRSNGTIKGYAPAISSGVGSFFTDSVAGDFAFRSEANNILFGRGSGASTMAVVGSNVGIGTTTPNAKLSVKDSSTAEAVGLDLANINGSGSDQTSVAINLHHFGDTNPAVKIVAQESGASTYLGNLQFHTRGTNSDISPTERMRIDSGGRVGIGTASPQTKLQVDGVISPATNNTYSLGDSSYRFTEVFATNGVINTSDRREKKEIFDANLGLNFINKLRPVSYRWNTGVDDDIHYGLIAQEAEQAVFESRQDNKTTSIVTHDNKTDRYGVRYSELISPLIKAVQELYSKLVGVDRDMASIKAENVQLKQENAARAKELDDVKARLEKIEKALNSK